MEVAFSSPSDDAEGKALHSFLFLSHVHMCFSFTQ